MKNITSIEALKSYIYGVSKSLDRSDVTMDIDYMDSTEAVQYVTITYKQNDAVQFNDSNSAYRALLEGFSITVVTEIRDYDVNFIKVDEHNSKIEFTFKQNRRDNTDKYTHGTLSMFPR